MNSRARIKELLETDGKKALVVLDENPFHPSGGGQPGDCGLLSGEGFEAEVKDCFIRYEVPVLQLKLKKGQVVKGMAVEAVVDVERNKVLSRMHTGEHILSRVLENRYEGLAVYKVAISEEESSISLSYSGEINWEILFEAEEIAQEIILKDMPVKVQVMSREKAIEIPDLKINWERVKDSGIRVVSIPGFDTIACSGTHTASTGQVGGVLVTGFRGSAPEWVVDFTIHRERYLTAYSRVMRPLLRNIGCPLEKLPSVYETLQNERRELFKSLDKLKNMVMLPWERTEWGGISILSVVVENLPVDLITPSVRKKMETRSASIIFALSVEGQGKASFVLAREANLEVDLRTFIKNNPQLGIHGGGGPQWVQGMTSETSTKAWLKALETLTNSNH
ncbi:MAG: Alanyl-tRNA synthetase, class IIc [Synergistales bacterium 54_9]|nr:MAG: Alanyl-tRNA synthetase, class IIc [Synergistales bacterium 54_9]MDK2845444.1 alanyl-tRNA synthetase [Synergistales bacterium]